MKIPDPVTPYLQGAEFSGGLVVRFEMAPEDRHYRSRIDLLVEISQGKNVIHLGCVDHDPDTVKKKLRHEKWLHAHLCNSATHCFGVDINAEGIRFLQEMGYADTSCLDILETDDTRLTARSWDLLLVPEVLEHIGNPVDFLSRIHKKYRNIDRLVVTVPNAFTKSNFRNAGRGAEVINSDHRYWFTPYTIAKVVSQAGFRVERLLMCRSGIIKKRSLIKNLYYSAFPLIRSNIILVAAW